MEGSGGQVEGGRREGAGQVQGGCREGAGGGVEGGPWELVC